VRDLVTERHASDAGEGRPNEKEKDMTTEMNEDEFPEVEVTDEELEEVAVEEPVDPEVEGTAGLPDGATVTDDGVEGVTE
jgi:hypothetical protein